MIEKNKKSCGCVFLEHSKIKGDSLYSNYYTNFALVSFIFESKIVGWAQLL